MRIKLSNSQKMRNRTKDDIRIVFPILTIAIILSALLGLGDQHWIYVAVSMLVGALSVYICSRYVAWGGINYALIFVAMGLLYTAGPVLAAITGDIDRQDFSNGQILVVYSLVAIIAYSLGDRLGAITRSRPARKDKQEPNEIVTKIVLLAYISMYIASKVFILSKIEVSAFLVSGRGVTMRLILDSYRFFSLFDPLVNLVNVFSFEMLMKKREKNQKSGFYAALFLVSFISATAMALIQMDRSSLLLLVLPLAFLFNYHKLFSVRTMVVFGVLLLFLFTIWKHLLVSFQAGDLSIIKQFKISVPSETFVWFRVGSEVTHALDTGSLSHQYGYSYLKAAESLIRPFGQDYESLSTWFVKTFHPSDYAKGIGWGFSSVVESVLNFGMLGPFVVFLPVGYIYKKIERKIDNSVYWRTFYALSIAFIYKLFRSEIYSILKSSFWLWAVPLIVVWFVSEKTVLRRNLCLRGHET